MGNVGRLTVADEGTRVLRRLNVRARPTGEGHDATTRVGVAIDVETTSTIVELGSVIELAVREF